MYLFVMLFEWLVPGGYVHTYIRTSVCGPIDKSLWWALLLLLEGFHGIHEVVSEAMFDCLRT